MEIPEYQKQLNVERGNMDEMLATQPLRYMWAVGMAVEAAQARAALEQKLDVVKAEVYLDLKSQTQNGKPLSEAAIKELTPADPRVQRVVKDLDDAKADQKLIEGLVDAFQQRKTMLAKMVERDVMGFYSDPGQKNKKQQFEDGARDVLQEGMDRRVTY